MKPISTFAYSASIVPAQTPLPRPFARKRFGQNFLHDPAVITKIVNAVDPQQTDLMLEIGPGRGAITAALLKRIDQLTTVEVDRDLATALAEQFANLKILQQDILTVQLADINPAPSQRWRIVGNLPYNISSPILFHLLEQMDRIKDIHIMLQKEVADRLVAAPGSKTYGRLSVMAQSYVDAKKLFDIGPGAFKPAPKVRSSFLRLIPLATPAVDSSLRPLFDSVVRRAFQSRRKMLVNTLSGLSAGAIVLNKDTIGIIIASCKLDPKCRAEQLTQNDFVNLTQSINTFFVSNS